MLRITILRKLRNYDLVTGRVKQVGPPPPFTLISAPSYSITLQPAASKRDLVIGFPLTIKQTFGANANTLQPMLSNSSSGTSTNSKPRVIYKFRNAIGIKGEYTTAKFLSTGLNTDIK